MGSQIDQYSQDDQHQPAAVNRVVVVQHRSDVGQCRVRHEKKTKNGPERRGEGRTDPIREQRGDDEHQAREKRCDD